MREKAAAVQELDMVDYRIMAMLQENARVSAKDISEKVFLSSTAVAARIERLRQRGIIRQFTTRLDPGSLGYAVRAFINLELEPRQKEEFYPYVDGVANVIACHCVTGDYAMLLEVVFKETAELDRFIDELQHFGRTRTMICFSSPVEHREMYFHEPDHEDR